MINISWSDMFEGIAKTNTTHTDVFDSIRDFLFEGIAKTNTTHTSYSSFESLVSLRVLLKQILPTQIACFEGGICRLRVLLKQILPTPLF